MIDDKVCRINVTGGGINADSSSRIEKLILSHSFVNRLSVLIKRSDQANFISWITENIQFKKVLLEGTLFEILKWILELDSVNRSQIRLVTTDKNILHDNSVSIAHGKLILKLNSETYLKSGFSFRKSNESVGNKKIHSQMYIHEFDLLKLEDRIKEGSKNDARLLWFSSNISKDKFELAFSIEDDSRTSILETFEGSKLINDIVIPKCENLINCKCPELTIAENEDLLLEQLEWLSYASILGKQITDPVDPYISRYYSMIDDASIQDISVFTIEGLLLSPGKIAAIYKYLISTYQWFALLSHGVKNTTKSYNTKGEHTVVDDGTNDIVIYISESNYALWEITDSGDPH